MSNAHHEAQKASNKYWSRKERYENQNPKHRLEALEFLILGWWRND